MAECFVRGRVDPVQKSVAKQSYQYGAQRNKTTHYRSENPTFNFKAYSTIHRDEFLVLGVVTDIELYTIKVALPNRHEAELPITNVCDAYTEKLQEMAADGTEASSATFLRDSFHLYMPVRCYIVDVKRGKTTVTVNPRFVNARLKKEDLLMGMTLSCCVAGKDGGRYLLDVGIKNIQMFLNADKADKYTNAYNEGKPLQMGHYLTVVVKQLKKRAIMCEIVLPTHVYNNYVWRGVVSTLSMVPGMRVPCIVKRVTPYGLVVKIYSFSGAIHAAHMIHKRSYEINDEVIAVVLFVDKKTDRLALSCLPHLMTIDYGNADYFEKFKCNSTIESTNTVVLASNVNAYFTIDGVRACELQVKDTKHIKVKPYRCKVEAFDYCDSLMYVKPAGSLKSNKDYKFHVGEIVEATILGIGSHNSRHCTVQGWNATIPYEHLPTRTLSSKDVVQCRVFFIENTFIGLTANEQLVASEDPIFSNYGSIKVNQLSSGIVDTVLDDGLSVKFYGSVKGFLPYRNNRALLTDLYPSGVAIRCCVTSNKQSLVLCLPEYDLGDDMNVSMLGDVEVTCKTYDWLKVRCKTTNRDGRLSKYHMADNEECSLLLFMVTPVGALLKNCVCIGVRDMIIFSRKPCLVSQARSDGFLKKRNSKPKHGAIIPGYVHSMTESTLMIAYHEDLIVSVHLRDIFDNTSSYTLSSQFHVNQSVMTCVNTLIDGKQIHVSLLESDIYPNGTGDTDVNLLLQYLKDYTYIKDSISDVGHEDKIFKLQDLDIRNTVLAEVTSIDVHRIHLIYNEMSGYAMKCNTGDLVCGSKVKAIILHTLLDSKEILFTVDQAIITEVLEHLDDSELPDVGSRETAQVVAVCSNCHIMYLQDSHMFAYMPTKQHLNDSGTYADGLTSVRVKQHSDGGVIVTDIGYVVPTNVRYVTGDTLTARVKKIHDRYLMVKISKYSGRVHLSQIDNKHSKKKKKKKVKLSGYQVGQEIDVKLLGFHVNNEVHHYLVKKHPKEQVVIDCSTYSDCMSNLKFVNLSGNKMDKHIGIPMTRDILHPMDRITGTIHSIDDDCIALSLPNRCTGTASHASLYESSRMLSVGDTVQCVIGDMYNEDEYGCCIVEDRFLEVADGVKQIEHEHELMAGTLVMGQIEDFNFKRITVRICHQVYGYVYYDDVHEEVLTMHRDCLRIGQTVVVYVKRTCRGYTILSLLEKHTHLALNISTTSRSIKGKRKMETNTKVKTGNLIEDFTPWFTEFHVPDNMVLKSNKLSYFEGLVIEHSENVDIWLCYLAHVLQYNNLNRARHIIEQAANSIHKKDTSARFKLCMASLLVEAKFGTEETINAISESALRRFDNVKVKTSLATTLLKTKHYKKAVRIFSELVKKIDFTLEMWLGYGLCYYMLQKLVEARDVMVEAMEYVDESQYFVLMSSFLDMEMRYGDAQYSHTLCEGLIDTHPEQIDMYWIYIELLSKENPESARPVLQRLLQATHDTEQQQEIYNRYQSYERTIKQQRTADDS